MSFTFNGFRRGLNIAFGFESENLNTGSLAPFNLGNTEIFQNYDPRDALELLRNSATAYSCALKTAKTASGVPWQVVDKDGEILENHPLNLLLENPHPLYSWQDLLELLIFNRTGTGNAYIRKNLVRNGERVAMLEPVSPITVSINPSRTEFIESYNVRSEGATDFIIAREEMIHFRHTIDPLDAYFGLSPLRAIQKVIQTDDSALEYQKFGLDNMTGRGLVFRLNRSLGEKQQEQLKADMKSQHQGAIHNGTPYVLGKEFEEPKEIGATLSELEFTASRVKLKEEICGALGVPYVLISPTDSTFANMETATINFLNDTIVPLLTDFRDTFNKGFKDQFPEASLDFDRTAIDEMKQDLNKKADSASKLFNIGFPRDEVNEILDLGFSDTDDGKVSYLPANLVPQSSLSVIDESEDAGN